MRALTSFALVALTLACSPAAQEPSATPTAPEPPASATPVVDEAPPPASQTVGPSAEPGTEPTAPAPNAEDASDTPTLCAKSCEAIRGKCAPHVLERCQQGCGVYAKMPAACQGVVAAALRCATKATDRLCITVAPESCRTEFKAVTECEKTGVAPVAVVETVQPAAPTSAWVKQQDPAGGFDVEMPVKPTLGQQGGFRTWSAESDGVKYVAGTAPAQATTNVDNIFLQSALAFAEGCNTKLKLHGRYDVDGVEHVSFDAPCDGGGWQGELRLRDKKVFIVAVKATAGVETELKRFRETLKLR